MVLTAVVVDGCDGSTDSPNKPPQPHGRPDTKRLPPNHSKSGAALLSVIQPHTSALSRRRRDVHYGR